MRLLIDSDVLLDFIGERESTAAAWVKLHAMELAGAAELWVSAEAFGEVRTALAEALSDHDALLCFAILGLSDSLSYLLLLADSLLLIP